jgi:hypothetical protein
VAGTYYSDVYNTLGDAGYTTSKDAPSGVAKDMGRGTPKDFFCRVSQTFTSGGAATLVATLQSSSDNSTFVDSIVSKTFALAELVAGADLLPQHLPHGLLQYIRVKYVIGTATTTAGTATCGIGSAPQANG